MTEIRIKVENDMTKAEERAILTKLMATFSQYPNNYLRSLFSEQFVSWAEVQISNDFNLNVYEYIEDSHKEDPELLGAKFEIARLTEQLQIQDRRLEDVMGSVEGLKRQALRDQETIEARDQEITTLKSALDLYDLMVGSEYV